MIQLLVALIGAAALVLAAVLPVLLSNRRTRAAAVQARDAVNLHGPDVLAALHRVEGKVDAALTQIGDLMEWKGAHEHAPHPPALAAVGGRRRRS